MARPIGRVEVPSIPLCNLRWERFAQGLVDGKTQSAAYVEAGFKANTGAASRLSRRPEIVRRVTFLVQEKSEKERAVREKAIERLAVTPEIILRELWDNAMKAKAAVPVLDKNGEPTGEYTANWNASNNALIALGKNMGMFIERSERGKPGEFEKLSPADVKEALEMVEDELAKRRAEKKKES